MVKNKSEPRAVAAVARAQAFCDREPVVVREEQLVCTACNTTLSKKLSTLKNHFKAASHIQKKQAMDAAHERTRRMRQLTVATQQTMDTPGGAEGFVVATPPAQAANRHLHMSLLPRPLRTQCSFFMFRYWQYGWWATRLRETYGN